MTKEKEIKICQNCRNSFVIEPKDFNFYEKINVPAPTWCPECRFQRRYAFRNEMNLCKVKCGLCGKDTISMYATGTPFPVYCPKCWWSDRWDSAAYGQEYDFSKPFFEQFKTLMLRVPRLSLVNRNPINSDYCNYAIDNKNCYLCFSTADCEDCYYTGPQVSKSKNCIACSMSNHNELCYNTIDCSHSYRLIFSQNCKNCIDSKFLFNCRNCQNCLGCVNLRNKQHCIFNQPYSKEAYFEKLKSLELNKYNNLLQFEKKFKEFLLQNIHRYANIENSVDVTGDNIVNSKRCYNCFAVINGEDSKFSFIGTGREGGFKGSYDISNCYPYTEASYEVLSPVESTHNLFSSVLWSNCMYNAYADHCVSVSYTFGCISLKNKQYCILNKQYTEESFNELNTKIIEHMKVMPYTDKKGRIYKYGEFFPIEISPFGYNGTVAQLYFPLIKDQAIAQGFSWKEDEPKDFIITKTANELPDDINEVEDSILDEAIECEHKKQCQETCTGAFRILKSELEFYKRESIPLPRMCIKCRNYSRIKQRNPLKLWRRKCMCAGQTSVDGRYINTIPHFHDSLPTPADETGSGPRPPTLRSERWGCPNEFETSYSPERPEIIYCEQCYNAEVV